MMSDCVSNWVSIVAFLTAVVSAIIYFLTLKEQRKQNSLLLQQRFYEQWQELVRQQLKIRDEMHIVIDVLNNNGPVKVQINGSTCLNILWSMFLRLQKAIDNNVDYTDWERIESGYDQAVQNVPEELEYYDIGKYNNMLLDIDEHRRVAFVGYSFGVTEKETKSKMPSKEALNLIFERYFKGRSTYFTHLCSMMHFLERNEIVYGKQIQECATILKDNMSAFELGLVRQYSDFDKSNSSLISKYLLTNE